MERHLLRSITFRPHWLGRHALPFSHRENPALQENTKREVFRSKHQQNDPFGMLHAYADPESLTEVSVMHAKRDESCWLLNRRRVRKIRKFYDVQNTMIERLLRTVSEHQSLAHNEKASEAMHVKIAVYSSLGANIVLSGVQLFAAVSSGSLSLFTTMADAIFDPLSNIMLIAANRATRKVDPNRFPSGRARLETVGNIVFCFLMMAVSFIIIAFSVRDIADRAGESGVNGFHPPALIAASTSLATKVALFAYCFTLRNRYSQVRIVWQDHRNDIFINAFGILTSVGGSKLAWWVDPAGAIALSLGITVLWCRTAMAEFMLVVGIAASPEIHQIVTYISLTHSSAVTKLDTVRVYHSGPRLIVEVDIVMDEKTQLHVAHDISERLQYKLEQLPSIERAYVHVDYGTTHKPEHAYIKTV
ncbi:hypothetical protein OQA88_12588 [Cercophora sp. LCS_1]